MSEDLEARARRLAERLSDHAEEQARCLTQTYGGIQAWQMRDQHADTMAELAEIVRLLVAEVSSQ